MFTGDPNTKEPFTSWIERTLLKSEARSTARSQRQRLKNELKISMGWVKHFYFLKISTVIKISTVFSLLLSVFKLNFNISECLRYQTGKTGQEIKKLHVNRIRESVSFNFGKEIQKDVCRLVTSVGYRKHSESPWGNEPQAFWIPRSDVLPLRNRLYGERGLLRSSYDVRLAYCAYVLYDVRESKLWAR